MDAVCSAYCYADFKNTVEKEGGRYIPIRCGNLNKATKYIFRRFKISPPKLVRDIYPRVSDVVIKDLVTISGNEPVLKAIEELDRRTLSVVPVIGDNNVFQGIISMHEISRFLISESTGKRPVYEFNTENFLKVLPGYFAKNGPKKSFKAPIMTGAMPFELSIKRIKELEPEKPLLVIGLREDLIQYAVDQEFPAVIITGFRKGDSIPVKTNRYHGSIFISETDTAETIRLLRLSTPVKNIMNPKPVHLHADDHFDEARDFLLASSFRGLPVFSDENEFLGIVTRRCFIKNPKPALIMIDHNETDQSVEGAGEAEIKEIIDHHRLGAPKTVKPIYIYARPVGSSCTLVYLHYKMYGIPVPKGIAPLLLSGILSDTVILRSPTTTETDRTAVRDLENISGLNHEKLGREIFSHSPSLKNADPASIINADFKEYRERNLNIGIGQVEVTTLEDIENIKEVYITALENTARERGLNWTLLLVTDVIKQNSLLFSNTCPEAEKRILFRKIEDHIYNLPGILSRKKQLLPEVLRIAEEAPHKKNTAASE